MAVLGRKPVVERFDEMTEPGQYFPVGEVFRYVPVSGPNVVLTLEVVPIQDERVSSGCEQCVLEKYCCIGSNSVDGEYFIPDCSGRNVFFKEV